MLETDTVRARILAAIVALPEKTSLKHLSLAIGKNPAYLQQFIRRGSPKILPERARHQLAKLLHLNEADLRSAVSMQDASTTSTAVSMPPGETDGFISIPFLEHPAYGQQHLPIMASPQMLHQYGITGTGPLRIAVSGDSAPDFSFSHGDMVIIDPTDTSPHQAGFFALDNGDHVRIRYLEKTTGAAVTISHHSTSGHTLLAEAVPVLGRVLFHFRSFSGRI